MKSSTITSFNRSVSFVRTFARAHKFWSAVLVLLVLILAWWSYAAATSTGAQTRYVLSIVQQGTIVSSVSASGQVAANQQLSLTPRASGQVIYVGVVPGQRVAAGTLIAEIDPTDAQKAVRNAQEGLESAELSLRKLQEPADTLALTQAQDALTQAQTALATDYQTGVGDIGSAFLDLPSIMTGIQNVDFGTDAAGNGSQWNIDYYGTVASDYDPRGAGYRDDAYNAYQTARQSYDRTFADFKAMPPAPSATTTEKLLTETYNTSILMQNAVKSTYSLIQFYSDQLTQAGKTPREAAATDLSDLNSYTGKLNPHISSLLGDTNSLTADKSAITEKRESLQKTQRGADPLDVQSSELSVTQQQNALKDAEDTLADYYVRAPFSGTIASVAVQKYDQASSGTAVATLITPQQLADLSLNEVDAAKIALGDKVTLTFDAIPDLSLTGTVAEIDPVGTVSQGVVSYDVKISFDAQDSRIKSGMTVNAQIQTAVRQNVLVVPQSAIKTQAGQSYVAIFTPPLATSTAPGTGEQGVPSAISPSLVPVTTGISDDTNTEILSGLAPGQQIVVRTASGPTPATSAAGASRGASGSRGGIRIP